MPTLWPTADDTFNEPSSPETTPLASAGTGNFNHYEHHVNLGDAVEALQRNVPLKTHDHSGTGPRSTPKLKQANTHESPDTDVAKASLHHTIGAGPFQAAAGNHKHDQSDISGLAQYICTSTTRPATPTPGMQIFETDTNRIRVWTTWTGESAPRWVLLPGASVPICRLLQGVSQRIINTGSILEWRTEEEDTFSMFNSATSLTELTVREPGLYSIDASVAWSPDQIFGDNAYTRIMINGQPTTRVHGEFVRGNFFTPGFVQSVDLSAKVRFKANDRLSIQAAHNGFLSSYTYSSTNTKQDSRVDVSYISP